MQLGMDATDELPWDPDELPRLGIKVSFLPQFIQECGGRAAFDGLNAHQVCETFIKPHTMKAQSSYCTIATFET